MYDRQMVETMLDDAREISTENLYHVIDEFVIGDEVAKSTIRNWIGTNRRQLPTRLVDRYFPVCRDQGQIESLLAELTEGKLSEDKRDVLEGAVARSRYG